MHQVENGMQNLRHGKCLGSVTFCAKSISSVDLLDRVPLGTPKTLLQFLRLINAKPYFWL